MKRIAIGLISALIPACPVAWAAEYRLITQELPPFTFQQDGKAAGPLVEIARAMCGEAKVECTIDVFPWRRAVQEGEDGTAQGIFPVLDVPERRAKFTLTAPVVKTGYAVYTVASDGFTYQTPADLKGRTIAVYGPSGTSIVAEQLAKAAGDIPVTIEVSNEQVLKKLAAGRYGDKAVALLNQDVANDLIKRQGLADARLAGIAQTIEYRIALSKASVDEAHAKRLSGALDDLIKAGKVKAILEAAGLHQE